MRFIARFDPKARATSVSSYVSRPRFASARASANSTGRLASETALLASRTT